MATGPEQELDLTRLVAIVLFLIVGGLFARMFFHNYVSGPARAADTLVGRFEAMRTSGFNPGPPPIPGTAGYEQMHRAPVSHDWRRASQAEADPRYEKTLARQTFAGDMGKLDSCLYQHHYRRQCGTSHATGPPGIGPRSCLWVRQSCWS